MTTSSKSAGRTPVSRIARHVLTFICCAAPLMLAAELLPRALMPGDADAAFRASSILYALGLTAYPIFRCVAALVETVRAHRSGETVEVPLAARLLAFALGLLSIGSADALADSAVRGATTLRAGRLFRHVEATRREAFGARMVLYTLALLVCLGLCATFASVGDYERFDTSLSATAGVVFVALLICAVIPGLLILGGLMRERARFRSRPAWSSGERPVAPGTEGLFARDDGKRRRYLILPRTAALGTIAFLACMIVLSGIAADEMRMFLESVPPLRALAIVLTAAALFLAIPLLIWWMDCSGRSLTQTVEIDPTTRYLVYTLTAGSGSERANVSYLLTRVRSYTVGPRCITVRCTCADGRTRTIFAPRTFANEDRFIAELERLRDTRGGVAGGAAT